MANVDAIVILDTYRWHDKCNDPTTPVNEADKGEKITVSAEEFTRGTEMTPPGLAKPGSKAAKAAKSDEPADDEDAEEPEITKPDQTPAEDPADK